MSYEPVLPIDFASQMFNRASSSATRFVIIAPPGAGKTTLCSAFPTFFTDLDAVPIVAEFYKYLSRTYTDKWFENPSAKEEKNAFFAQFDAPNLAKFDVILTAERNIVLNPNFLVLGMWLPTPEALASNLAKRARELADTNNPQRFVDSTYVLKGFEKYLTLARQFSIPIIMSEMSPFNCSLPSLARFAANTTGSVRFRDNILAKIAPFLLAYFSTLAQDPTFERASHELNKDSLLQALKSKSFDKLYYFDALLLKLLLLVERQDK